MVTYLSCVTIVSIVNFIVTNIVLFKKHLLNKKSIIKVFLEFFFIWLCVSLMPKNIVFINESLNINFYLSFVIVVFLSGIFLYLTYFLLVKENFMTFLSHLNVDIKKNLKKITDYIKKEIEEDTEDDRDEVLKKKISDIKNSVGNSGFSEFLKSEEGLISGEDSNMNNNNNNDDDDDGNEEDGNEEDDNQDNNNKENEVNNLNIDESKNILESLLESHAVKIGAVDEEVDGLNCLSDKDFRGIDELMEENNGKDIEEDDSLEESLNDSLEGILENKDLLNEDLNSKDININKEKDDFKEDNKAVELESNEKDILENNDKDLEEEIESKEEKIDEEEVTKEIVTEKEENLEKDIDTKDDNLLSEINEITGEKLDSKEFEDSLIEELNKYEKIFENDEDNDTDGDVESEKKNEKEEEKEKLSDNTESEKEEEKEELSGDTKNVKEDDESNNGLKSTETSSFLGKEVKKLLDEGLEENNESKENLELENEEIENVNEKEKVEKNDNKKENKENNKNLQFNGTFDSIESENKKADNQANELLDLAFKQKVDEDYQGAIESFSQALDMFTEDDSSEVVFWIVLDICMLYKQLGQSELAKEILNGYYSEYKGLMSEEIREKIEDNL